MKASEVKKQRQSAGLGNNGHRGSLRIWRRRWHLRALVRHNAPRQCCQIALTTTMLPIELSCIFLLLLGLALRARLPGLRDWARDAPIILVGAWLAEDTCIRAYAFTITRRRGIWCWIKCRS